MQEFMACYSDAVFGIAYLILGIVAIAMFCLVFLFSVVSQNIPRKKNKDINSIYGIVYIIVSFID